MIWHHILNIVLKFWRENIVYDKIENQAIREKYNILKKNITIAFNKRDDGNI